MHRTIRRAAIRGGLGIAVAACGGCNETGGGANQESDTTRPDPIFPDPDEFDTGDTGDDGPPRLDVGVGPGGGTCVRFELSELTFDGQAISEVERTIPSERRSAEYEGGFVDFDLGDVDGDDVEDLWIGSYGVSALGPLEASGDWIEDSGGGERTGAVQLFDASPGTPGLEAVAAVDTGGVPATELSLYRFVAGAAVRMGSTAVSAEQWSVGTLDGQAGVGYVGSDDQIHFDRIASDLTFDPVTAVSVPGAQMLPAMIVGRGITIDGAIDRMVTVLAAPSFDTQYAQPVVRFVSSAQVESGYELPASSTWTEVRDGTPVNLNGERYFIAVTGTYERSLRALRLGDTVPEAWGDILEPQDCSTRPFTSDLDGDGADDVVLRCAGRIVLWPGDPNGGMRPLSEALTYSTDIELSAPGGSNQIASYGLAVGEPSAGGSAPVYVLRTRQVAC